MAERSVARCEQLDSGEKVWSLEHPYRSFMWYTKKAIALAAKPGVRMAVFSNCCFGGRREKWTAILTNSQKIYEALNRPECPHGLWYDYQPYYDDEGWIRYPEEEAEYPVGLCEAYAKALREELEERGRWPDESTFRVRELEKELSKYSRFESEVLKAKVASRILKMEQDLVSGNESQAMADLLRHGHYRGTDIRLTLTVEHHGDH